MHVLLIEDDETLGQELVWILETGGHDLIWCRHGSIAHISRTGKILILFGVTGSDPTAINSLRWLCQTSPAPVLALVSTPGQAFLEQLIARGELLEECPVTPVNPRKLLEKIEHLAHKAAMRSKRVVTTMDVTISLEARAVWTGEKEIPLTAKEFEVLAVLAQHAGHVASRKDIEDAVWGTGFIDTSRSLDVHMAALRAKLNRPGLIQTVRGRGYRLGKPVREQHLEPSESDYS